MRYPAISGGGRYSLTADNFSGGINLADSPEKIGDNQMRDSRNILFNESAYETRGRLTPGKNESGAVWTLSVGFAGTGKENLTEEVQRTDAYVEIDGITERVFAVVVKDSGYIKAIAPIVMHEGTIRKYPQWSSEFAKPKTTFFIASHKKKLYLFINEITGTTDYNSSKILTAGIGDDEWTAVSSSDMYIPTLITNGRPNPSYPEGDMLEGYNMLSARYKAIFDNADPDKAVTPQIYTLPTRIPEELNQTYWVRYTTDTGGKIETNGKIVYNESTKEWSGKPYSENEESQNTKGNVRAYWKNTSGGKYSSITLEKYNGTAWEQWEISRDEYIRYGVEIEVPYPNKDGVTKICDNTIAVWFGGGASGLTGGTRLFIAGGEKESGIIRYSDLNNPLYFPENNYAYAGNGGSRITALAKQSDMLVIFGTNSTYYTTYNEGDGATAEEVQNGSVIDITATSAYFPIIPINSEIGCDCPATLALCNNRLVWVNSYGKVYTLTGSNQYSKSNIYELSVMVEKRLKEWGSERLCKAFAAAADGKYMLFCGNECLVMEYRSYGFIYIASYYRNRTGDRNVPWYYLDFPETIDGAIADYAGNIRLLSVAEIALNETEDARFIFTVNYGLEFDSDCDTVVTAVKNTEAEGENITTESRPVTTEFSTKLYNMGRPAARKGINTCYLGFGYKADGIRLGVSFATERGETQKRFLELTDGQAQDGTDYIKELRILPIQPRARKFGICVTTDTPITLDHLVIKYKLTGEVK